MFALLICAYMIHAHPWYWNSTNSEIPSNTCREQGTHGHAGWRAAQAILVISTEVLGKLQPMIAYLTPTYEPIVVALMVGCTALAVRIPEESNSDTCYGTQSLEDAA
jgi:hypothetical protein